MKPWRNTLKTAGRSLLWAAAVLLAAGTLLLLSAFTSVSEEGCVQGKNCRWFLDGAWREDWDGLFTWRHDIKCLAQGENALVFTDFGAGFQLTLPRESQLDLTLARASVEIETEDYVLSVSRERSTERDLDFYLDYYQNRFYESDYFRGSNGLTLLEDSRETTAGMETRILTLAFAEDAAMPHRVYTFAYQKQGIYFMRYLFRSSRFDPAYQSQCRAVLNSYRTVLPWGRSGLYLQPQPKADPYWDADTAALYRRYCQSSGTDWGIFVADVWNRGLRETIPALEDKIGLPFDIVLMYQHLGEEIDRGGLEEAARQGKVVEFTLQVCANNNMELYGYTPMFDLLQGKKDDQLRCLAAALKDFGRPVLFRLNNEMNSDWTSYSGIITLSDPEIYVGVWRYIHDFFRAEGVRNLIWVFNPNDNSYPPCNWNHFLRYFPGEDYVQMIGITGYNTGDYYADYTGERWRSFPEIYGGIQSSYAPYFGDWPWIITEFGCSSHGGDKAAWIREMFASMADFPNIKAAVWWSCCDYDAREGHEGEIARPYFLDETEQTLQAFAQGRQEQSRRQRDADG